MRIHNVNVLNRVVYIEDVDLIQGTVKEDKVNLTLDSEWDGLEIKVCFSDGYKNNIMPEKDINGNYVVPWEVMQKPGKVVISVIGIDEKTEQILKHAIGDKFIVHESSTSDITEMTQRTPETLKAMRGFSAYDIAKQHGFEGTEAEWLSSLKGDKGDKGDCGFSAYELAQQAGFSGDEAAWRASLKGDKGDQGIQGIQGISAYEVAKKNGFNGTEVEWLASLKGNKGDKGDKGNTGEKGDTGDSAYALAIKNGFKGTEQQWLSSLKGVKGDKGDKGDQGIQGVQGIQGIQGERGYSAYDIAVQKGFSGSEDDWLLSVKAGLNLAKGWSVGTSGTEIVIPTTRADISDVIVIYSMVDGTTTTPFAYTMFPIQLFVNYSGVVDLPSYLVNTQVNVDNLTINTSLEADGIKLSQTANSYIIDSGTHKNVTMTSYYKLITQNS